MEYLAAQLAGMARYASAVMERDIPSILLSIAGGILAGFIVVGIEWVGRYCYARRQQRNAIRELGNFFAAWESGINTAQELSTKLPGRTAPLTASKDLVQRVHYNEQRNRFHILMSSRWSRHLSERQTSEIRELVAWNEWVIEQLPWDFSRQVIYDDFFQRVREITWLKF